jgi:hypothetical protein
MSRQAEAMKEANRIRKRAREESPDSDDPGGRKNPHATVPQLDYNSVMGGEEIPTPTHGARITLDASAADAQTFGSPGGSTSGDTGFGIRVGRDHKPVRQLGGFDYKQLKELEEAMVQYEGTTGMKTNLSVVTSTAQRSTIDTQLWSHTTHGTALGQYAKGRYEHTSLNVQPNTPPIINAAHTHTQRDNGGQI